MNPVSVLDYRYGTDQMREIFRADSYLGFLMEVEATLAEVQELYNDGKGLDATTHSNVSNLTVYCKNNGLSAWTDESCNDNH